MFSARQNQLISTTTNESGAIYTRRIWHLHWHCPKALAHHLCKSVGGRLDKGIWTCFACAEEGEKLGTLQPHPTHFCTSVFFFGKRTFLPGLRWKSSRQQLSWACTPWLAALCRALCLWQNRKYVENELAFSLGSHHFLMPFTSWDQQCYGTPGLSWCRIRSI